MGCRSDYMEPNQREKESFKIITLLKEVGLYDDEFTMYGLVSLLDEHTDILCEYCQNNDVKNHSLELQIWWRDHKLADEARITEEIARMKIDEDKFRALSKLTEYERDLLGL